MFRKETGQRFCGTRKKTEMGFPKHSSGYPVVMRGWDTYLIYKGFGVKLKGKNLRIISLALSLRRTVGTTK